MRENATFQLDPFPSVYKRYLCVWARLKEGRPERERDAAVVVHIWRRSGAWYKGRGALSVAGIRVDGQREER